MTRIVSDNGQRPGHGGDGGATGDEASGSRSMRSLDDDGGGARTRRPREDRSGRRSLTGLELRRQRSI